MNNAKQNDQLTNVLTCSRDESSTEVHDLTQGWVMQKFDDGTCLVIDNNTGEEYPLSIERVEMLRNWIHSNRKGG